MNYLVLKETDFEKAYLGPIRERSKTEFIYRFEYKGEIFGNLIFPPLAFFYGGNDHWLYYDAFISLTLKLKRDVLSIILDRYLFIQFRDDSKLC